MSDTHDNGCEEQWRVEDFSDYDDNGRYGESYEIWYGEGTYREAQLNKTLVWIATCPTKEAADAILTARAQAGLAQRYRELVVKMANHLETDHDTEDTCEEFCQWFLDAPGVVKDDPAFDDALAAEREAAAE